MFESIKISVTEWEKIKLNFPYTKNTFDSAKCHHLFKRFTNKDPDNIQFEDIINGIKTMGAKFLPLVQARVILEDAYERATG